MDTPLFVEERLQVTCLPNKYCYALVTSVLRVNGYINDEYHRHIDVVFQCTIYGGNIPGNSIERVEEFKYLGTTVTDQNSIQEEIKS